MDKPEKTSPEDTYPDIFDKSFFPESFYRDNENRLGGVDLFVVIGNDTYLLTVESYPVHVERQVADYQETKGQDDSAVYVVPREEILPSDIQEIKTKLIFEPETLKDVLVRQIIEPNDPE